MSHGPSKRLFKRLDRGLTLLETLITTALFSIVVIGVYLLYTTMQNTLSRGELKTDLQQNARVAMDRMVQEIRMAGYDPSGAIGENFDVTKVLPPKAGIRAASGGCLSLVAYNPSTGLSAQITYDLSGTTLRRRQDRWDATDHVFSAGSGDPLAESVNLLTFTYYDAFDQVISPVAITSTQRCPPQAGATALSIVQLDYGQMRQIRRVAIAVQTRDTRPAVAPEFYTLTVDVRLRNR